MFSCRFVLLVSANLATLLGKIIFSFLTSAALITSLGEKGIGSYLSYILFVTALSVLLPGLTTALVSTWHSKMLKTFLNHPSFFILPVFTCFTFSSSKKTCCNKKNGAKGHIRFSVKASLCNLFVSFLASVVYVVICCHAIITSYEVLAQVVFILFFPFIGLLLSLLFLCNMRPTKDRFKCCCCCSCCSCKAAIEYGIFKPDQPTKHFILRIDADGEEEICSADDQEEEADEEETEGQMEMEQEQNFEQVGIEEDGGQGEEQGGVEEQEDQDQEGGEEQKLEEQGEEEKEQERAEQEQVRTQK